MGSMLHGELKLADEAKLVAQAAQENAEQSLSHALTMVEKANQRKKESEQIDKRVNELADKVEDTAKDIEESEKQTEKDSELAKLVLEKANQARTKANETSKRITDMLATLEKILNDLGGLFLKKIYSFCRVTNNKLERQPKGNDPKAEFHQSNASSPLKVQLSIELSSVGEQLLLYSRADTGEGRGLSI